eukprot:785862-Pleurochrysis_carterae.AAC.1
MTQYRVSSCTGNLPMFSKSTSYVHLTQDSDRGAQALGWRAQVRVISHRRQKSPASAVESSLLLAAFATDVA